MSLFLLLFPVLWDGDKEADVLEAMTVEYVMLDVFAHDKDGHPITDLSKDDFVVKEGRKEVKIGLFDTVDYRFAPSPAEFEKMKEEAKDKPEDEQPMVYPQTFIIVLAFATAEVNQIRLAMTELKDFFRDLEVRPNVNFLVISLDHGQVTPSFMNNPKDVLAYVEAYEEQVMKSPGGNLMFTRQTKLSYLEAELNDCLKFITGDFDNSGGFQAANDNSKVAEYYTCITSAHDQFINIQTANTDGVLKSLEGLIAGFAKVPGLKSMYFVSPGFSMRPGEEAAALSRSYADRFKSGSYQSSNNDGGAPPSPPSIGRNNMTNEFRRVVHAATSNRIVFHTFRFGGQSSFDRMGADGGVGGLNEDTSIHFDTFSEGMNQGLGHLSDTTGGRFTPATTLGPAFQRVFDDHSFHYILGYDKPSGSKRYRTIKVECIRDGVRLSHRGGYYPDPKKAK